MLTNTKAFTLMEILVVVTIIGILAAIAVPSYIYAVEQGRKDACAANIQILITQVERYRLVEGENISLSDGQTLIDFLEAEGYLVGQELACPLEGEYVLVPPSEANGRQSVRCTHEDTEE